MKILAGFIGVLIMFLAMWGILSFITLELNCLRWHWSLRLVLLLAPLYYSILNEAKQKKQ